jgi:hypothetical protein
VKSFTKTLVATVAASAMALASATPALARDRDRHDRDDISAGDVIAGALIVGGIAALASSAGRDGYRSYGRAGSPRNAVEQCVYAAERSAARYSYGRSAKVTDIRDVDAKRDGWRIKGRIAVNTLGRNWRSSDRYYGNGWNGDYRGWNQRYRGYDAGKFTCDVRYGRVVDMDFDGIRGLR